MKSLMMLVLLSLPLVGCSESVTLKVNVHDESGHPVTNAIIKIETLKKLFMGAGSKPSDFRTITAHADSNGVVSVKFDVVSTDSTYRLSADGYYQTPYHDIYYKMKKDHLFYVELAEHEKEESVVMRKIRNPIPMFGYGPPSWLGTKLPLHGEYGFDMVVGDFLSPHGKGEVADFYILKNYDERTRTGKSALLFKGRGNGAYKIKAFTDSRFRSCYAADTNAVFETEFRHEYVTLENRSGWREVCDVDEDECLILRTRCQYNEKGELVSCHYSKIYGKIEIRSYLNFRAYAFNPTPNDTNLEFDTRKNLLKRDTAPYLP